MTPPGGVACIVVSLAGWHLFLSSFGNDANSKKEGKRLLSTVTEVFNPLPQAKAVDVPQSKRLTHPKASGERWWSLPKHGGRHEVGGNHLYGVSLLFRCRHEKGKRNPNFELGSKRALHDWSDEECLKILKNCHKAIPNDGKVIVMNMVIPIVPEPTYSYCQILF
ncbi:hypothetical protein PIB30_027795 [Stylosanthes scabra]|uniref:O-methyltransferase C-terminal domain-containing protein n=1 Tax=Stylosanthes scabra TaxID=79078 RepID=A0ABU6RBD2_9FABA|nr:hypothetical protein [Stylosanthes scabra]